MLFRTVYGPELGAIYHYICSENAQGRTPAKESVYKCFLPGKEEQWVTQNVDDALSFLKSAGILDNQEGYVALADPVETPFRLRLLKQFTLIKDSVIPPSHPTDSLYGLLLSELFIQPNQLYLYDVHAQANRLKAVREVGGISKEKIQSWKRVMAFLGVGLRVQGGFLCAYSTDLVASILGSWEDGEGTLQRFFEDHFCLYLPYLTKKGDISMHVLGVFEALERSGKVALQTLQDSPTRFYFGSRKLRGIRIQQGELL